MSQFHLTRASFPALTQKRAFGAVVDDVVTDFVSKAGARKNKEDSAMIQDMHDKCMKLADGATCGKAAPAEDEPSANQKEGAKKGADGTIEKKGARHSAADVLKIKEAHDIMCALGAKCDGVMDEDTKAKAGKAKAKDGEDDDGDDEDAGKSKKAKDKAKKDEDAE